MMDCTTPNTKVLGIRWYCFICLPREIGMNDDLDTNINDWYSILVGFKPIMLNSRGACLQRNTQSLSQKYYRESANQAQLFVKQLLEFVLHSNVALVII